MDDTTGPKLRNHMKEKLASGGVVASMTVRLVRGIEIARLARAAGFDTLYVDLEHNSFSLDTTSQICIAALEVGITPLVRVPANTPDYIARVLDGGALGIIAPHVETAEQARAVVACAKYAPLGSRSFGGPMPHLGYRAMKPADGTAMLNDVTLVVLMMESRAALENVEALAAVEGVDMLMIGTNDLCADLGIAGQFDHPMVHDAYIRTIAACRAHGRHAGVGGLASRPDLAAGFVRQGARYVSTGADLGFLLEAATRQANAVHAILPPGVSPDGTP